MIPGVCLSAQVNDWVKKRLTEKFMPLSEKPDSVKEDLEKLQKEVTHRHTEPQFSSRANM